VARARDGDDPVRFLWVSSGAPGASVPRIVVGGHRIDELPLASLDEPGAASSVAGSDAILLDVCDLEPRDRVRAIQGAHETLLDRDPLARIVTLVPAGDLEAARAALEGGSWDVVDDEARDRVVLRLGRAARLSRLQRQAWAPIEPGPEPDTDRQSARRDPGDGLRMVGASQAMQRVFSLLRRVAATDVPVLITGESGTGKELAATAIHERSLRCNGPFVVINCSAIPESLLESELFGVERGAFTGAADTRPGRVELAHGGTLFLDEVGELPPLLQVKLLRFLDDHVVERVGGNEPHPIDVRVVAATNRDLAQEVSAGRFRDDLYYRLAVVLLHMPPLRERGEDIILMARFFLERFARESGKPLEGFTPDAVDALLEASWPGNVRELANRLRRAVVLAEGTEVRASDLGFDPDRPRFPVPTLGEARARADAEAVRTALQRTGWNKVEAARALGISRTQLYEFMRRYEIPNHDTV
jgi:two-component system NtrC family response regulator